MRVDHKKNIKHIDFTYNHNQIEKNGKWCMDHTKSKLFKKKRYKTIPGFVLSSTKPKSFNIKNHMKFEYILNTMID